MTQRPVGEAVLKLQEQQEWRNPPVRHTFLFHPMQMQTGQRSLSHQYRKAWNDFAEERDGGHRKWGLAVGYPAWPRLWETGCKRVGLRSSLLIQAVSYFL